jgi:FkbM family methyltransferase
MRSIFGLRKLVRLTLNRLGADIVRAEQSPRLTALALRKIGFGTVLDIGANEGQFARWALNAFPHAKLVCFEPLPHVADTLCRWASSQGDRVHVVNCAIGDKNGRITMYEHEDHSPSSSVLEATELTHELYPSTKAAKVIEVPIKTLDDALTTIDVLWEKRTLMKIDVQGYEDRVLAGARRTLLSTYACILEVNFDGLYRSQASFRDLVHVLYEAGLRYVGNLEQVHADDGHAVFADCLFVRQANVAAAS